MEEVGSATVKLIVTFDEYEFGESFCYESESGDGELVAVKVVVRVREGEAIVGKVELGERGMVLAKYGLSVLGDWLGLGEADVGRGATDGSAACLE